MIDYAESQENIWNSHYEAKRKKNVLVTNAQNYIFLILSAHYCHFLFLLRRSVLFPISLFLLILLCVVTPRPALRHHHSLICSYSLGNPVCLLIPSTYSSPILPSYFLFLPQESLVTSRVPSGTSWNKQSRDGNVIWTELKKNIDTGGSGILHLQWNASVVCTGI